MAFAAPLAIAGTALGGLVSAGGSLMQGQASANAYNYRAGVATLNEKIALQNADYQSFAGEEQAYQSGEASAFRRGQIVANQGAGNLAIGSGSNKLVQDSQQTIAREDQSLIRQNAQRANYGERVKAAGFEAEATGDRMAASTAKESGFIGAASSLISGVTGVATKWSQFSSAFGDSTGADAFNSGNPIY